MWDLHRAEILPYRDERVSENPQTTSGAPSASHPSSRQTIDETLMTSGEPEMPSNSINIYPANERYKMLHENPALVCMWFFIRQLINMDVMRQTSYPVAYEKWYARKFEFQDRGSVHEHAVKSMMFMWIKAESHGKKAEDLTSDDFEEVACRTDKLCMYCESGKVREIMVGRILSQIHRYIREPTTPASMQDALERVRVKFVEFRHSCSLRLQIGMFAEFDFGSESYVKSNQHSIQNLRLQLCIDIVEPTKINAKSN